MYMQYQGTYIDFAYVFIYFNMGSINRSPPHTHTHTHTHPIYGDPLGTHKLTQVTLCMSGTV